MSDIIDETIVRNNMQIAFNIGGEHILKQSKKALVGDGTPTCGYLTKDGLKCAIGALIPEGHPAQNKVMSITSLINKELVNDIPVLQYNNPEFLRGLQMTHDLYPISKWKLYLQALANEYQLDASVLDKYIWNGNEKKYECAG